VNATESNPHGPDAAQTGSGIGTFRAATNAVSSSFDEFGDDPVARVKDERAGGDDVELATSSRSDDSYTVHTGGEGSSEEAGISTSGDSLSHAEGKKPVRL
jgi:hypothetical protein